MLDTHWQGFLGLLEDAEVDIEEALSLVAGYRTPTEATQHAAIAALSAIRAMRAAEQDYYEQHPELIQPDPHRVLG